MREIRCPRVARPLEKLGPIFLRATRESLVKSARYAVRYARSEDGQIGALRALNLANGALRVSQHSLTEVCVKCFFFQCGVVCAKKWVVYTCMCALNCEEPLKTFACDSGVSAEARDRVSAQYYVAAVPRADPGGAFVCRAL